MTITECTTCHRMFNDTDNTAVCPNGHENRWATTEDDDTYTYHLRKVTW